MSKKNKNNQVSNSNVTMEVSMEKNVDNVGVDNDVNVETNTNNSDEVTRDELMTPTKGLDTGRVRSLLKEYDATQQKIRDAMATIKDAEESRGRTVKAIFEASGKKKFRYGGKDLTLVVRKSKKTGEETYFFRGDSEEEEDVLTVD